MAPATEPERQLVDLQFEEVSNSRTAVLNRESVRMRGEGWTVQSMGDHLIATRRESGASQLERMLIAIAGFLALAYAATSLLSDEVKALPGPAGAFVGGAVLLGALIAFLTRGQASRDRQVSVGVDGQGRPYLTDVAKRDF